MKNGRVIIREWSVTSLFQDDEPDWSNIENVNSIIDNFYDRINNEMFNRKLILEEENFVNYFNYNAIQYGKSYRLTPQLVDLNAFVFSRPYFINPSDFDSIVGNLNKFIHTKYKSWLSISSAVDRLNLESEFINSFNQNNTCKIAKQFYGQCNFLLDGIPQFK
jgi:hypothetical protein